MDHSGQGVSGTRDQVLRFVIQDHVLRMLPRGQRCALPGRGRVRTVYSVRSAIHKR